MGWPDKSGSRGEHPELRPNELLESLRLTLLDLPLLMKSQDIEAIGMTG